MSFFTILKWQEVCAPLSEGRNAKRLCLMMFLFTFLKTKVQFINWIWSQLLEKYGFLRIRIRIRNPILAEDALPIRIRIHNTALERTLTLSYGFRFWHQSAEAKCGTLVNPALHGSHHARVSNRRQGTGKNPDNWLIDFTIFPQNQQAFPTY